MSRTLGLKQVEDRIVLGEISLRIDLVDTVYDDANTRWWPVVVNGQDGWISGNYLTDSDGATTTQPGEPPASTTPTATSQ
jgi:hypothetical protein